MESESPGGGGGGGGTLLVLEPKSLRSFTTNDEYLFAMKEDLAEWFACLYKMQIDADTFLSILETGVLLCRHANEVLPLSLYAVHASLLHLLCPDTPHHFVLPFSVIS